MTIDRRPNETDLQYHKRLVYGKLVDKTLSDIDYSELAEAVYGQSCSSDFARRMMYGSCKTLQLLDKEKELSVSGEDILAEIDAKRIELQKERQKTLDQRTALNKEIRDQSRLEQIHEIIVNTIKTGGLPELEYVPYCQTSDTAAQDTDLLVSLNDVHYGLEFENFWGSYSPDIFKERLRSYLRRTLKIARDHNCENCTVWCNGDLISGNIHYSIAVSNKENVIQQVINVSELIAMFLSSLSKHFKTVRYVSVSGNHSRLNPNKDMVTKDERLDDLVEWYLAARLQNFDNVLIGEYDKIDCSMYSVQIRGKTYVGVHGDYDVSNDKLAALKAMAGDSIYAILLGHTHHNAIDTVQGTLTVTAGSFVGTDDYCIKKRIYSKPEQLVCVCDTSGIRCFYNIQL